MGNIMTTYNTAKNNKFPDVCQEKPIRKHNRNLVESTGNMNIWHGMLRKFAVSAICYASTEFLSSFLTGFC